MLGLSPSVDKPPSCSARSGRSQPWRSESKPRVGPRVWIARDGCRGVSFPDRTPSRGLPTLRPPRLRYLGIVAVDEAWTTPPNVVNRAEGVTRDGRCRSRARCPRPIHGRGPPVRRAAVGRRWATRATNHGVQCPGIRRGVSFPDQAPRRGVAHQAPCHTRDGTGPVPYLAARHLRRIDQPDPAPALVQQPRPRFRHLAFAAPIRIPPRRRRPSAPTVEPQPRTRPVQHHGRNPLASLPVVLAHVQQHVRQRPAFGRVIPRVGSPVGTLGSIRESGLSLLVGRNNRGIC